jgi:hypothetical protein
LSLFREKVRRGKTRQIWSTAQQGLRMMLESRGVASIDNSGGNKRSSGRVLMGSLLSFY